MARNATPPTNHDELEAAVAHLVRLAVEHLVGEPESLPSLRTSAVLARVVGELERHSSKRRRYAEAAKLVDLLAPLYDLAQTETLGIARAKEGGAASLAFPISEEVMLDKVRRWSRSRGMEMTDDAARRLLWGPSPRGAKVGGPKETLTARVAAVTGLSQSTIVNIERARSRAPTRGGESTPASDSDRAVETKPLGRRGSEPAIRSYADFARAFADTPVDRGPLLFYALKALGFAHDERARALAACGYNYDTILDRIERVASGNGHGAATASVPPEGPIEGAGRERPARKAKRLRVRRSTAAGSPGGHGVLDLDDHPHRPPRWSMSCAAWVRVRAVHPSAGRASSPRDRR